MKTPRRRPDETSQVHGRRFEAFWARLFGVKPIKGSGALWYAKLDVGDGTILWSCKHTDKESFRISSALMREAEQAIYGPGGIGGGAIPGIAVSVDGEAYVTLRAEDFLRLMATSEGRYVEPSKVDQKRIRSRVPALLRTED